jgi:hypothetical protein
MDVIMRAKDEIPNADCRCSLRTIRQASNAILK